jgi:hypothetical protein
MDHVSGAAAAEVILTNGPLHFQMPGNRLERNTNWMTIQIFPKTMIPCPACTGIHLVNRKTGELLGQDDE